MAKTGQIKVLKTIEMGGPNCVGLDFVLCNVELLIFVIKLAKKL
jgi:hypothetical protein